MPFERALAERCKRRDECGPLRRLERRRNTDVVQRALVVVEAEQERADELVRTVLVPPEAGDDAVRSAHVLDLEHGALLRLVRQVDGLGDDAVEPSALELHEPASRDFRIAGHRREQRRR
jgi:hypothetical protein